MPLRSCVGLSKAACMRPIRLRPRSRPTTRKTTSTDSGHGDALVRSMVVDPVDAGSASAGKPRLGSADRRNRARSEEHTSELQSLMRISYAVFCLKKKKIKEQKQTHMNNDDE